MAARVRELLDDASGTVPAADSASPEQATEPATEQATEQATHDSPRRLDAPAWLPGADFDRQVPRHASDRAAAPRGRWRWDPGRRGVAALGGAAVAIVAATGWWLAASRTSTRPVSATSSLPAGTSLVPSIPTASAIVGAPAPPGAPSTGASATAPSSIVVDVAGKVVRPGVYHLAADARIYDALRAAGGVRRGVSTLSLNLAEPLHDGEQIVVGRAAGSVATPPAGPTPASGAAPTTAPVDLNTATLEQLETLPGVGPVLGQNIVDYRTANGPFTRVDQLAEVNGIGDVRLAQLTPLVTV